MGRASGPNHINRDSSHATSVATDNTGGRRSSFKTSAKDLFSQGKDEDDRRGT
jgi:hypothetical protein